MYRPLAVRNRSLVIYLFPMAENSHEKTLAALGVTQPDQVAPLFAQLLAKATADLGAANSPDAFEKFRVEWLGRKAGVVTLVGDNWLKPAPKELKPSIGQELNRFKAQLDAQMEARRAAIESGAEETISDKDRVDLS